jgi:signal peptidase I
LQSDTQSKTQAKRSSSEAIIERSALDADRNGFRMNGAKIYPELIVDLLINGHKVKFRALGYSMYPTILNGDEITIEPIKPEAIRVGDIIFYRNQESLVAHRVVKIEIKNDTHNDSQSSVLSTQSCFILRGDARPICDAPVVAEQILGKVVLIETNGRRIDPYCIRIKLHYKTRRFCFRIKRLLLRSSSRSA